MATPNWPQQTTDININNDEEKEKYGIDSVHLWSVHTHPSLEHLKSL